MKLTFSDLQNQYLRKVGVKAENAISLLPDFVLNLSQRYQLALAKMQNYVTQPLPYTASTVVNQQFYSYPVGYVNFEACYITVGSVRYPLQIIASQYNWDVINAIQIQASAVPQFIFLRRDDFGVWPIPQDIYGITLDYHLRDRDLSVDDYSQGTVSLTLGSATVTGVGTTFTPAMINRWFQVTDLTARDQGYWYRVSGYTNATTITLDRTYQGVSLAGVTYRIGQVPELPDEGHTILLDGTLADFYAGLRNDNTSAQQYENKFWTGDMNNPNRREGDDSVAGGLIGMCNRYSDRNAIRIVQRKPKLNPLTYKVFATTIT